MEAQVSLEFLLLIKNVQDPVSLNTEDIKQLRIGFCMQLKDLLTKKVLRSKNFQLFVRGVLMGILLSGFCSLSLLMNIEPPFYPPLFSLEQYQHDLKCLCTLFYLGQESIPLFQYGDHYNEEV